MKRKLNETGQCNVSIKNEKSMTKIHYNELMWMVLMTYLFIYFEKYRKKLHLES